MWCDFAGEPAPTLRWQLDERDILDSSRLSSSARPRVRHLARGVKRAVLTHTFNNVDHTGVFVVTAENSFGRSACNFTVVMLHQSLKIRPLQRILAVEGRPLRLSCHVLGGLNAASLGSRSTLPNSVSLYHLKWHFRGGARAAPLKLPRDHRMHLVERLGLNQVVISPVVMADAGKYSCSVEHQRTSGTVVRQDFSVEVVHAPIARPLANSTLNPENRLLETCTYKNDADLPVLAWWSVALSNTKQHEIVLRDDRNTLRKLQVRYTDTNAGEGHLPTSGLVELPPQVTRKLPAFMRQDNRWHRYAGRPARLSGHRLDAGYAGRYICNVLNAYGLSVSVMHIRFHSECQNNMFLVV